jgi:hypothetical protein
VISLLWNEIVGEEFNDEELPARHYAIVGWALMRQRRHREASFYLGVSASRDAATPGAYFDLALNSAQYEDLPLALSQYVRAVRQNEGVRDVRRRRYYLRVARYDIRQISADPRATLLPSPIRTEIDQLLDRADESVQMEVDRREQANTSGI